MTKSDCGADNDLWHGLLELGLEVPGARTFEEAVSAGLIWLLKATYFMLPTTDCLKSLRIAFSSPYYTTRVLDVFIDSSVSQEKYLMNLSAFMFGNISMFILFPCPSIMSVMWHTRVIEGVFPGELTRIFSQYVWISVSGF